MLINLFRNKKMIISSNKLIIYILILITLRFLIDIKKNV